MGGDGVTGPYRHEAYTLRFAVGGWKIKKSLKDFETGQFLCKNEF